MGEKKGEDTTEEKEKTIFKEQPIFLTFKSLNTRTLPNHGTDETISLDVPMAKMCTHASDIPSWSLGVLVELLGGRTTFSGVLLTQWDTMWKILVATFARAW